MSSGRGVYNEIIDDISVLLFPASVLKKVYQDTGPRVGHTCHRLGSRTMPTPVNTARLAWEIMGDGVSAMSHLI